VVRVANRCCDAVRRRVQNQTLGHRGRKGDSLYTIRKLLLTGSERLNERGRDRMLLGLRVGDPDDELVGAWLAKESVRDVYLAGNYADAAVLLDKPIVGCLDDEVAEVRSLGVTLASWRTEILARHTTGASNGPTEGLNLCVKKVKRLSVYRPSKARFHMIRARRIGTGETVFAGWPGGWQCESNESRTAIGSLVTRRPMSSW
jgi:transposase